MRILTAIKDWISARFKRPATITPRADLFEGVEVSMGGRKIIIPPLSLKDVKKHSRTLNVLAQLDHSNVVAQAGAIAEVIHAAIARNYPGITVAQVEEMLDLGSLVPAIDAVMRVSGLGETGTGSR